MSDKVKFIKPQNFIKLFEELGECVHSKIFEMMDNDLFQDREKWIEENKNFDWSDYKDNDEDSKEDIRDMDIETICILIGQVLLFGRIIKKNKFGDFNLPKGEVPLYTRQIDEKGNEEDLYNISSLKIQKNWRKKNEKKKRIKEKLSTSE